MQLLEERLCTFTRQTVLPSFAECQAFYATLIIPDPGIRNTAKENSHCTKRKKCTKTTAYRLGLAQAYLMVALPFHLYDRQPTSRDDFVALSTRF